MTRRRLPRPICPHCGSAAVVTNSAANMICNRCHKEFSVAQAFAYPMAVREGEQRSSVEARRNLEDRKYLFLNNE